MVTAEPEIQAAPAENNSPVQLIVASQEKRQVNIFWLSFLKEGTVFAFKVVATPVATRPCLWSKSFNFRWVKHNIKMLPHHWKSEGLIPHISTFKWNFILFQGAQKLSAKVESVLLRKLGI